MYQEDEMASGYHGRMCSSVVITPWAVMELTLLFRDKEELGLAVLTWKIV